MSSMSIQVIYGGNARPRPGAFCKSHDEKDIYGPPAQPLPAAAARRLRRSVDARAGRALDNAIMNGHGRRRRARWGSLNDAGWT
jgi:hypothetical protein